MATFREAEEDVTLLVAEVQKEHHAWQVEMGVTVKCLMAFAPRHKATGLPKGPALKHHGYPALALIKVTSHADRVAGLADAVLKIDGDRWPDLPAEQQRALIDHELTHLVYGQDFDDCSRPKLRTRPHDAEMGLFWEVVERHGQHALESQAYLPINKQFTQLVFNWG